MTHAELTAALKGDYRSDSAAERHNCYPVRRPSAVVDPRPPLKPVPSLQRWI